MLFICTSIFKLLTDIYKKNVDDKNTNGPLIEDCKEQIIKKKDIKVQMLKSKIRVQMLKTKIKVQMLKTN